MSDTVTCMSCNGRGLYCTGVATNDPSGAAARPEMAGLAKRDADRDSALQWAARFRELAPVVDIATARAARDVAEKARADAAYAAAAREKSDAFSRWCWDESLKLLDAMIRVTEEAA